jgi:exosortase/archaeosortase family protein
MNNLFAEASKYIKKYKLYVLRDVAIFALITLTIHYSYRFWANSGHYWPIEDQMNWAHDEVSSIVFNQSVWFIDHVLHIPITTGENRMIYFQNSGYIGIDRGCSGLKPNLQFILLMLIFPGPWKYKAWFIPMGIVIVHLTNLFRITGLAVVTVTIPQYWKFSHDYLFRPFFYVVIFFLWVWWVEKYRGKAKGSEHKAIGRGA